MKVRSLILALAAWAFMLALPSWTEARAQTETQAAQSEFAPPPIGDDNAPATKGDLRWYWGQNERRWRESRAEDERRWEANERRRRESREDSERRWRDFRAENQRQWEANERRWEQNNQRMLQLTQEVHNLYLAILSGMAAILAVLLGRIFLEIRLRDGMSRKNAAAAMAALLVIVVGALTIGMTAVVLAG